MTSPRTYDTARPVYKRGALEEKRGRLQVLPAGPLRDVDVHRRVVVIGGSDLGRQAIDLLQTAGEHEVVAVVDRDLEVGTDIAGHAVVGTDEELAEHARTTCADAFLVAIGDNFTRSRVTKSAQMMCPDLLLLSAFHPSATISARATVGAGTMVLAGAVVSNDCQLGTGVLLGTNASLDHDCTVGSFASLGPGAATGGHVHIGSTTALAVGATVINAVSLGAHTVVGAGAVVLDDLPDHVVAYGVPARAVRAGGTRTKGIFNARDPSPDDVDLALGRYG